jgi:outer membrane PBP1 activator LpoA protein
MQTTRTSFQRIVIAAMCAIGLVACQGMPPPATFPGAGHTTSVTQAETAVRRGDHAQAAAMYEALAEKQSGSEATNLKLQAADEWLQASRSVDAGRILNALAALPAGRLTADQTVTRRVLDADVALANGQAQTAWERISALPEPGGPTATRYLDTRMRIAMAAARPVDSVRAEIAAERLSGDNAAKSALRERLLGLMRLARERGIKLESSASQDVIVRGWLELGAMVGAMRGASLTGGGESARWRAAFPNHPATELLGEALPQGLSAGVRLNAIALLLPLTGSAEARNIRDGFVFALSQIPANVRPQLNQYDTSNNEVLALMSRARSEGNNFIVGPLLKPEVAAAASASPPLPTLALNALAADTGGPNNFFQFALAPEDEARATARRILADGLRRGVAIVPTGDWGTRVSNAFTQEYLAGGGVLVAQAAYDPAATDYSAAIKQLLGVNESEARLRRIQSITGTKFEFEPRPRADVQMIFAAASQPNAARLIRPQLGYQNAGDLPTYMSSSAYTSGVKSANDDLNGVLLPGMPWLLPDASLDPTRAAAEQANAAIGWRSQYFAFGFDACQLTLAIAGSGRDVERIQVAGVTGQLTMGRNGRVVRQPLWARIDNGEAQLMGNGTVRQTQLNE